MRRIYLVGAHSTGKTTLANYISNRYNIRMLSEVSRKLINDRGLDLSDIRSDIDTTNEFQREIFEKQLEMESNYSEFVSDRAFDNLAYSGLYSNITNELFFSDEFEEYMKGIKNSIVFFIRPREELLEDDGTRKALDMETLYKLDGIIKFILEIYDVSYVSINTSNLSERIRTVEQVMDCELNG